MLEYGEQDAAKDEKERPALVKDVFASERRKAKVLNFSIAYGKSGARQPRLGHLPRGGGEHGRPLVRRSPRS